MQSVMAKGMSCKSKSISILSRFRARLKGNRVPSRRPRKKKEPLLPNRAETESLRLTSDSECEGRRPPPGAGERPPRPKTGTCSDWEGFGSELEAMCRGDSGITLLSPMRKKYKPRKPKSDTTAKKRPPKGKTEDPVWRPSQSGKPSAFAFSCRPEASHNGSKNLSFMRQQFDLMVKCENEGKNHKKSARKEETRRTPSPVEKERRITPLKLKRSVIKFTNEENNTKENLVFYTPIPSKPGRPEDRNTADPKKFKDDQPYEDDNNNNKTLRPENNNRPRPDAYERQKNKASALKEYKIPRKSDQVFERRHNYKQNSFGKNGAACPKWGQSKKEEEKPQRKEDFINLFSAPVIFKKNFDENNRYELMKGDKGENKPDFKNETEKATGDPKKSNASAEKGKSTRDPMGPKESSDSGSDVENRPEAPRGRGRPKSTISQRQLRTKILQIESDKYKQSLLKRGVLKAERPQKKEPAPIKQKKKQEPPSALPAPPPGKKKPEATGLPELELPELDLSESSDSQESWKNSSSRSSSSSSRSSSSSSSSGGSSSDEDDWEGGVNRGKRWKKVLEDYNRKKALPEVEPVAPPRRLPPLPPPRPPLLPRKRKTVVLTEAEQPKADDSLVSRFLDEIVEESLSVAGVPLDGEESLYSKLSLLEDKSDLSYDLPFIS